MNFLKDEEFLKKIFIIFLIIQPALDIYILFSDGVVNFFKFSPATIIRILTIGILLLMVLFSIKFNKRYAWFGVYGLILIVYCILHHINCTKFNVASADNFKYSILAELFYIIRMILPYTIAFITYHVNLNKKQIYKVLNTFVLIISTVVVVSNVLCLSIQSYSESYTLIKTNIFGWFFNYNYTNVELASKGIFTSANQIGSLLSMLLPITIYYYIYEEDNRQRNLITLILQTLSLIMIGTRISSYSWIFIYAVMLIIYLYMSLIKYKVKYEKNVLIIFLIVFCSGLCLLKFAPISMRKYASDYKDYFMMMEEKLSEENKNILDNNDIKNLNKMADNAFVADFIKKNYQSYSINKEYLFSIYNYKKDPYFWYEVFQLPYEQRSDSRQIEQLITSHIYKKNNNSNDKWLGIGFSRFRNGELYLERDFKVHFYTLGILGSLIFVYPYIAILVIAAVYLLITKKARDNLFFISCCFCLSLMVIFGYLAGSVLDQLIITLIAGFIFGLISKNILCGDNCGEG